MLLALEWNKFRDYYYISYEEKRERETLYQKN